MKALSRKCTAFLLSLTLLLTLAPTALASEALGDDLDLRSTTLNRGAELGEGTFWSNTFSDLRQENYVVYTPNTSVTPIVTYGDLIEGCNIMFYGICEKCKNAVDKAE